MKSNKNLIITIVSVTMLIIVVILFNIWPSDRYDVLENIGYKSGQSYSQSEVYIFILELKESFLSGDADLDTVVAARNSLITENSKYFSSEKSSWIYNPQDNPEHRFFGPFDTEGNDLSHPEVTKTHETLANLGYQVGNLYSKETIYSFIVQLRYSFLSANDFEEMYALVNARRSLVIKYPQYFNQELETKWSKSYSGMIVQGPYTPDGKEIK
ncbi:hypothetical protein K9L27_02310 [Candidatus Gracilibacteria bacterium]|nr:hypothetical protein [Candidatus Gracilibacteria bacterium]